MSLLDAESPGAFSAQLLVPADSLHLEVKGAGQIRFPVRAPQARKLCDVAHPARFGRGEQTLTDPGVRDTWEIPPDLVTITRPRWAATLKSVLDEVRDQLGLPPGSRLETELHAMLVYSPGQFFIQHQDSEKNDAMIGTLVVTLPSSHTGGELIVEHRGDSVTYRSSKNSRSPATANRGPTISSTAGWGRRNRGHTKLTRIVSAGSSHCPRSATRCVIPVSPARQRPGGCWPPPGAG